MADYISCVEASGGNREELLYEVNQAGNRSSSSSGGLAASGAGPIVRGKGSLTLNKASEDSLATRLKQRWHANAMASCESILGGPAKPAAPKPVVRALPPTSAISDSKAPARAAKISATTPNTAVVKEFEEIATNVWAYKAPSGSDISDFSSEFSLLRKANGTPQGYRFTYSIPSNSQTRMYAVMGMRVLQESQDFGAFEALEVTFIATDGARVRLMTQDSASTQDNYHLYGDGREQRITIPMGRLIQSGNPKKITSLYIVSDTDLQLKGGKHAVDLLNLRLLGK